MPIDASIPLKGLLINRNDENLKKSQNQIYQAQAHEYQRKADDRRRLADLLPQALGSSGGVPGSLGGLIPNNRGGVIDERGATEEGRAQHQQDAINQLYAVDPDLALKLDERQRKHAGEVVDDLSAAVRWADTPDKWQYVQQHYGQKGVNLSGYRFEDRERGLVSLGQMGDYLKDAPKPEYRSIEAGGSLIDVSNGNPRVVIAPNPGGFDTGSHVSSGGVPQGAADMLRSNPSLAPQFDEKYGPGAAQRVLGGQTGYAPSGGFL